MLSEFSESSKVSSAELPWIRSGVGALRYHGLLTISSRPVKYGNIGFGVILSVFICLLAVGVDLDMILRDNIKRLTPDRPPPH